MAQENVLVSDSKITPYMKSFKVFDFLDGIRSDSDRGLYSFYGQTTPITKYISIENIENSDPITIHSQKHGIKIGDKIRIFGVQGMNELQGLENNTYTVLTILDENSFQIPLDSTSFSTYIGGGEIEIQTRDLDCSDSDLAKIHNNMLGIKRISFDDVSAVIERQNWKDGIVFNRFQSYQFNDCQNYEYPYYCVNDSGDVYICIFDGGEGRLSVVEPTHTTPEPLLYSDTYVWQYLYSLDLQNNKFVSDDYIPVYDLCVDNGNGQWSVQNYSNYTGKILSVEVVDAGNNYVDGTYNLKINGDGEYGSIQANVVDGVVDSVEITNVGQNYTYMNAHLRNDGVVYSSDGKGAEFKINLEPVGTIGKNAFHILNVNKVQIRSEFDDNEGETFMINNDYCVFGLLHGPRLNNGSFAKDKSYDMRNHITLANSPASFAIDEVISNNDSESVLTEIGGLSSEILKTLKTSPNDFKVGDVISGNRSGATNTIAEISKSEIVFGSGYILFFKILKKSITRNQNQKEVYNITLSF